MPKLVFDVDFIIFEAVSVAQEVFITATHKPTGYVQEFKNRTELWGHHGKKIGGWIGVQNEMSGNTYYKAEDFDVVDGVRPRPFKVVTEPDSPPQYLSPEDGAKNIIDGRIKSICSKLNATEYIGYTGTGEVFRHKAATLLPYKGHREDLITPLLLKDMKKYVQDKHNCKLVTDIEADDAVSIATIEGYKKWKKSGNDEDILIAVAVDKDAKQTEGWHFNPDKDESPRLIEGFGKLWLTEKGDVDGCGRMWLYYQIAVGDTTDNYKSNCFSKIKFASKGGYDALKDCTNDKEAFKALVEVFKKLYPEPIEVEGCKGKITIDWLHVMQEMATMAMMLRHPEDKIDIKAALTKLGITYG